MNKTVTRVALACMTAGACWAGASYAQFAKPDDAIAYRQSALTLIASHFGRMAPVMKGQADFNADQIKANVAVLKTLSTLPWPAFGEGMQGGNARPEVWSDAQGFKQAQDKFKAGVEQLSAAADTGDLARVRAAFGDTAATCKACHDSYRQKK